MSTATMTSKGQITVPAELRARLGLRAGVKVDFVTNAAGEVVLRPRTADIRAARNSIPYDGPPVSVEDMDEAVGNAFADEFRRSLR
jgi:AbrB family looped-hinge helix DNA binding protein